MIARALLFTLLTLASATAFAEEAALQGRPDPFVRAGETRRLHLRLDGDFTFGIGGQSALGGQVHLVGYTGLWNTRFATGTLDLGAQLAYGHEPMALAPWLRGVDADGAAHRVQALVTVGHTFHLGASRRTAFGLHVFGGLNHWVSSYTLRYNTEGLVGSATVQRDHFVYGGALSFAYRFSRHVGLHLSATVPVPQPSSYVVTIFSVGTGLTFYLR
jgi:hypothetical protein